MRIIEIECIGDGSPRRRDYGVWELNGFAGSDLQKTPIKPHKDYAAANGAGSRGVRAYYLCREDGTVYEVLSPQSWGRSDHYYVAFYQGNECRLSFEDVVKCLSRNNSG